MFRLVLREKPLSAGRLWEFSRIAAVMLAMKLRLCTPRLDHPSGDFALSTCLRRCCATDLVRAKAYPGMSVVCRTP